MKMDLGELFRRYIPCAEEAKESYNDVAKVREFVLEKLQK